MTTKSCDTTTILQTAASTVLGVQSWASHTRLIDLGANSFDIVRVANVIETEFKKLFNDTTSVLHFPNLVEYLLTKSLDDTSSYIQNEVEKLMLISEPVAAALSNDDTSTKKESQIEVKKQAATNDLSPSVPPSKTIRMESFGVKSYRRGMVLYNGL